MANKILILTGDGGEGYETWYAYHRFQEAGYVPHIGAPAKRRLNLVMHDFEEGWDTYIEKPGYGAEADLIFSEVNVNDYVAVLVIGGRAPEYLRNNPKVIAIMKEFDAKKKWIFSICHGIQILIAAGLVRGRKLTCYENVRLELEHVGAKWVNQPSVMDGNIITSQTWESHPEFYRQIFQNLV